MLPTLTIALRIAPTLLEATSVSVMMDTSLILTITRAMVGVSFEIFGVFSVSTDVNECEEETAECHTNATCSNIDGSYNCSCVYGYSGDGRNCTSTLPRFEMYTTLFSVRNQLVCCWTN